LPLPVDVGEAIVAWLRDGRAPNQPVFPTSRGRALSRDAVALLASRHAKTASRSCPTLATKAVSPHVLRHTAAMNLLHAGCRHERHRALARP
jgi:integrase/recombinase XerD